MEGGISNLISRIKSKIATTQSLRDEHMSSFLAQSDLSIFALTTKDMDALIKYKEADSALNILRHNLAIHETMLDTAKKLQGEYFSMLLGNSAKLYHAETLVDQHKQEMALLKKKNDVLVKQMSMAEAEAQKYWGELEEHYKKVLTKQKQEHESIISAKELLITEIRQHNVETISAEVSQQSVAMNKSILELKQQLADEQKLSKEQTAKATNLELKIKAYESLVENTKKTEKKLVEDQTKQAKAFDEFKARSMVIVSQLAAVKEELSVAEEKISNLEKERAHYKKNLNISLANQQKYAEQQIASEYNKAKQIVWTTAEAQNKQFQRSVAEERAESDKAMYQMQQEHNRKLKEANDHWRQRENQGLQHIDDLQKKFRQEIANLKRQLDMEREETPNDITRDILALIRNSSALVMRQEYIPLYSQILSAFQREVDAIDANNFMNPAVQGLGDYEQQRKYWGRR
jgi:hypothetical protein